MLFIYIGINMISKIEIIDKESGTTVELPFNEKSVTWDSKDSFAINVVNSFSFQCFVDVDEYNEAAKRPFFSQAFWRAQKTACQLVDKLNDLVEEFYAPGNTRRERRAIQREFNKLFSKFDTHCKTHNINYKYKRT